MKVYKTFYFLTIVFSIVYAKGKEEAHPSSSKDIGTVQTEKKDTKQGRAAKDKRPPLDEIFKLITESIELIEKDAKIDQKIFKDESQKIDYFIKMNNESESNLEENFIIFFFDELFKARNLYKEEIIKQQFLNSNLYMTKERKASIIKQILESSKVTHENIENYLNSEMHELDKKIYLKLSILVSYIRQDCLEFKEKYNEIELKKSKERCENEKKNCVNEFDRIIAINNASNPLCRFRSYWSPQDTERKKWLESVGTWEEQGKKSRHEKQLFEFNEKEVDAVYFDDAKLVNVEIDKHTGYIEDFSDPKLDLDPWLKDNMNLCNFKQPTPIQKYVIPALSTEEESFDLIGVAETGSGKTAAFLIPLINRLLKTGKKNGGLNYVEMDENEKRHYYPSALILSPTIELTIQLYKEVLKLTYRTPIVPGLVHGKEKYETQYKSLEAGCHILIATPLRLYEMMVNRDVSLTKCNFLVIDEIDQMLDNGFIPQVRKIENKLPSKNERTTAMFSATFDKKMSPLASEFLRDDYIKLKIIRNIPPNLKHEVIWVDDYDKDEKLKELLNELLTQKGKQKEHETIEMEPKIIIFANTKDRCNRIAEFLENENFNVLIVHANISIDDRIKNLKKFMQGKEIKILVASDVLSRGTDIKDITHVINYDSPDTFITYIHRVGRTARMGKEGTAITFFNEKSTISLELFEYSKENLKYPIKFPQEFLKELDEKKGKMKTKKERGSYFREKANKKEEEKIPEVKKIKRRITI
ncbi:hypothetical protein ACQ4LE_010371 [Meloidogyne hapla]